MNDCYGLGQVGGTPPQQQNAQADTGCVNQVKPCVLPAPEPTSIDLARNEQQTSIALRLAMEIFLQVPSMAAIEAIEQGVGAYHEAWIRGRKRVL